MSTLQTLNIINAPDISVNFGVHGAFPTYNNLKWAPDGHISVLKDEGNLSMWLTAGRDSYVLSGPTLDTLELHPAKVLSPANDYEDDGRGCPRGYNGYRGFGSVIPGTGINEGTLLGFYHNEWHPDDKHQEPFTAAVGVAQSKDNGITWDSIGSIIEGPQMPHPMGKDRVYGAGQLSAIQIGEYVHVYHTQWCKERSVSITVSRALLDDALDPTKWKTYDGTSFSLSALGGNGTPIVSPTRSGDVYAALPGVSFNTTLGKYVMTYETNTGFYLATSDKGLTWNPSHQIAKFPQTRNDQKSGDTWFSYPTLLSEESDQQIGSDAFLYFSRGIIGGGPHTMARVSVQISNNQDAEPRLK